MRTKLFCILITIGCVITSAPSFGASTAPVTDGERGARFILFHSTNLHGEIEPCG